MLPQEPFDFWNIIKKRLHFLPREPFFREGEVWWCSIGHNVGHEFNGKNEYFERPVLILVKINMTMAWVLCLTSKHKENEYRFTVDNSQVVLSQIMSVSSRRFLRRMSEVIPEETYKKIIDRVVSILHKAKLRPRQHDGAENLGDSIPKSDTKSAVPKV